MPGKQDKVDAVLANVRCFNYLVVATSISVIKMSGRMRSDTFKWIESIGFNSTIKILS